MSPQHRVAIVGGGLWGRALASAAARAGSEVTLISRREEAPPEGVSASRDFSSATPARIVLLAVPSKHAVATAHELGPHLDGGHFLIHGVRGLVGEGLSTICEAIRRETPARRMGALGGPVLAAELAAGSPSLMVIGSRFREVIEAVREGFGSPGLRLYGTRDLTGLEWASALSGCFAVAIGYALESGLGPGLVGAFTTRTVHEAARIAVAAGGDQATMLGLAGLGDLLAAVGQGGRPEVTFGRALARGESIERAKSELGERIEALTLLPKLGAWTVAHGVRAPITHAIVEGLFQGVPREEVVRELMNAPFGADE